MSIEKFEKACKDGDINALDEILKNELSSNRNLHNALSRDDYKAFGLAVTEGHVTVLDWFKKHCFAGRPWGLSLAIASNDYWIFHLACSKGHTKVLDWMQTNYFEKEPGKISAVIPGYEYGCFRYACQEGHTEVLNWLQKHCFANNTVMLQKAMVAEYWFAFRWACKNDHIEVVDYLYNNYFKNRPMELVEALFSMDENSFVCPRHKGYLHLNNLLLESNNSIFKCAAIILLFSIISTMVSIRKGGNEVDEIISLISNNHLVASHVHFPVNRKTPRENEILRMIIEDKNKKLDSANFRKLICAFKEHCQIAWELAEDNNFYGQSNLDKIRILGL